MSNILQDFSMILAIDPGINNCGLALIDIENNFNVKETYLVKNARKFTDEEKIIEAKFGSRSVKV
jgi:Holliday junction resolvasome RuvABC endonuclease subunit